MSDLYTVPELAELWKCSEHLIYLYLRSGKLKGFKLGASWRITEEARLDCQRLLTETVAAPSKRYTLKT